MKKIPTLFIRDFEPPSKGRLVKPEVNPEAAWVLEGQGWATRKFDGVCCMIDAKGILWKRREVKAGQLRPPMFTEIGYDVGTDKAVGWVPADRNDPADKYMIAAYDSRPGMPMGTYEFLGPKSQGNAERFSGHTLLRHGAVLVLDAPRTFNELWDFFNRVRIEGIVWHGGPNGAMAKIKARDFGINLKVYDTTLEETQALYSMGYMTGMG